MMIMQDVLYCVYIDIGCMSFIYKYGLSLAFGIISDSKLHWIYDKAGLLHSAYLLRYYHLPLLYTNFGFNKSLLAKVQRMKRYFK